MSVFPESQRNSNIEVLRLLCMFFILMEHFFNHSFNTADLGNPQAETIPSLIYGFCICAVNCFVLISGYFGLKLSFDKAWKLYAACAFYGLAGYFIHLWVDGQHIGRSIIYNGIFPFSNPPGWWFIKQYFFLLLVSPILNYAIDHINRQQFKTLLVILTVLNIYFGFLWRDEINGSGYHSLSQFIYIYFIGRYLRLHYRSEKKGLRYLAMYAICSLSMGCLTILGNRLGSMHMIFDTNHYNHPLVIMSAIYLFLFFNSLDFKSRFINWISVSALSIYLITENSYIGGWYYPGIKSLFAGIDGVQLYLMLIPTALLVMFVCLSADKIRLLICRPVDKLASHSFHHVCEWTRKKLQ